MNSLFWEKIKGCIKIYVGNFTMEHIIVFSVLCIALWMFGDILLKKHESAKRVYWMLVSINISAIMCLTLAGRKPTVDSQWKWTLFWSYVKFAHTKDMLLLLQMIWNVVVFVPLGLLFPSCNIGIGKEVVLISLLLSVAIEVCQGVFRIGWFETDDIMHNVLGTIIGWFIYSVIIIQRKGKQKICNIQQ